MGIEPQHPLPFPINRLPHRTGLQNGSRNGFSGKLSVAHRVNLYQRQPQPNSNQSRPLRCRIFRPLHRLRLARRFETLFERLLLVDR